MEEQSISKRAVKIRLEDTVQKIIDIFELDDGKSFVEKKKEAISYLENHEDSELAKTVLRMAINDDKARQIKEKFWKQGDIIQSNSHVHIRCVSEIDRKKYIELQKETCIIKSMLKEESYQLMLWKEHTQDKSLMFTIEVDDEYAGFCGINNLTHDDWEIAVEILAKFRRRGIAYTAINIMLSEIKLRLGVEAFRVKIYPDNYASQYLFEKLGAIPYGIAEFFLHDENSLNRCEEENLDAIDDKLVSLAERFGVEPRKLLSHVLEYKLKW